MLLHLTVEYRSLLHYLLFLQTYCVGERCTLLHPDIRGASFSIVHHGKWSRVESVHVISVLEGTPCACAEIALT